MGVGHAHSIVIPGKRGPRSQPEHAAPIPARDPGPRATRGNRMPILHEPEKLWAPDYARFVTTMCVAAWVGAYSLT
jgi:hypothetical protein